MLSTPCSAAFPCPRIPERVTGESIRALSELFGNEVVAVAAEPSLDSLSQLYPDELAIVERVIDTRKAEFATARVLGRRALRELGVVAKSLCPHPDRSPRWPEGIVGSITHTAGYCAVAVARTSKLRAIGLDVEQRAPLKAKIISMICCEAEADWISSNESSVQDQLTKLLFSAKEAFYKCQYPLTKTMLDFRDVELQFDDAKGEFRVIALRRVDETLLSAGDVRGKYQLSAERIFTAAWVEV